MISTLQRWGRSVVSTMVIGLGSGPLVATAAEFWASIEQAPEVSAARDRVEAARARQGVAGAWADPELDVMGMRRSMPMSGSVDMWEMTVRQPLPRRGERGAQRDRAEAVVTMAQAEYARVRGEVAADVTFALAGIAASSARNQLLEQQIDRLRAVQAAVDARLAAGSGARIADRLTLQTRVAALELMLAEEERERADADAEIRARLDLPPTEALPAPVFADLASVAEGDSPLAQRAAAREAEAEAMAALARASSRPMTALALRLERENGSMGNDDTLGFGIMSDLPWRARRVARGEREAVAAERQAARTERRLADALADAASGRVERAERVLATARMVAAGTRSRLQAEYEAYLRSAGAGLDARESAVLQLVTLLELQTDTEVQVIAAELAAAQARADLWRYVAAPREPRSP